MPSNANFSDVWINGYPVTNQGMSTDFDHAFKENDVLPFNVGIQQYLAGKYDPKLNLGGYFDSTPNQGTAHNLLSPSSPDTSTDIEFLYMQAIGQGKLAVAGDPCLMGGFTLTNYSGGDRDPDNVDQFQATFAGRNRLLPLGRLMIKSLAKGTLSSTPFDSGANAPTAFGAAAMLQVFTPTGVAATGNIGVPTQPVANDTVVVNGVTYTWKAALTPAAGEVLIGATALASAQNLFAALTGGDGAGTRYAVGSTSFNQQLNVATVFFAAPTGANNTINITYATTGAAGNAFTLAKTGTGGLTISGATLTGGVAGETASIIVASATTSGGSYTTHATFVADGTKNLAELQLIASGVTINRWIKITATLSGATQNFGFAVSFGRFWFAQ